MWNMIQSTEYYNNGNSDLGPFNGIERGSLMRSDDAVETFKRHAECKCCAAQSCPKYYDASNFTVPAEIRWHADFVNLIEI